MHTAEQLSHVLSEYHNQVVIKLGAHEGSATFDEEQGMHYDVCQDLAIEFIASAGLAPGDEDDLKVDVTSDVQTLLTLAMFRAPELRTFFEKNV